MVLIHIRRNFSKTLTHLKSVKVKNVKGTSSHDWLSRQLTDPYVEKAKMMNYRCRSAFKLIEMDDRFQILKPGDVVIDCGAAPGSWTQVAVKRVNSDGSDTSVAKGMVLSIDKQQIFPVEGATVMGNMDFTDIKSQERLLGALEGKKANAVISDMAPNATGVKDLDNENIIHLSYSVLRFAVQISNVGASIIVKLFGQAKQLENDFNRFYSRVKYVKPNSSRSDSAEIFLLGRDFKGLVNKPS